jgi:hypothetical protein
MNLDRRVIDPHIRAYFTYVYPVQGNAFIHQATLLRQVAQHRVPRKLLLALCAVSNRFLPPATPSTSSQSTVRRDVLQALEWAKESKTLCIVDEEITTETVAAALLLAKHDVYMAKYSSAWMMSSVANRAAMALGLHKEVVADMPWTEREARRRLFWGCYCLDRMVRFMLSHALAEHFV